MTGTAYQILLFCEEPLEEEKIPKQCCFSKKKIKKIASLTNSKSLNQMTHQAVEYQKSKENHR